MPLHISSQKDQDKNYVIELKGSIDSDTYAHLRDELKRAEAAGARSVSLNFCGVDYISSIGIKVLIDGMKALKERKSPFLLFDLQPQVRKVLDVMRLTLIFDILGSHSEAEQYLQEHYRVLS